jgi:hypothetical protein
MRRRLGGFAGVAVAVGLLGAAPAAAQVAWDAPMLMSPGAPSGPGIFLMGFHGGGIGVMGTLRSAAAPGGLGLRAGIGEDAGDDLAAFGGFDVSGSLLRATDDTPVDIFWFAGGGLGIGDDILLSFPLGLTIGGIVDGDNVRIVPYASPRIVLDACLGDSPSRCGSEDLDLTFAADLGLDLSFNQNWMIRFGASIGDREGIAIGLAFPR